MDFSGEVERSLRVCDGAIGIFDSMMGVEVWDLSHLYMLIAIIRNCLDAG